MPELKLVVETDAPIGSRSVVERVLRVLTTQPQWMPERFGLYEPLRKQFDAGAPESFLSSWVEAGTGGGRLVGFHFRRRKRYDASAIWPVAGGELSSLHFTFYSRHADEAHAHDCLKFGTHLFEAIEGQYGHLCTREEFASKNMTDWWIGRTGSPEGGKAYGTDRRKHLPGIYWANFFGPAYGEFFGNPRIESAPAHAVRRLATGWVVLTASNPYVWDSPAVTQCEEHIREHLGADAFFRMEAPHRKTRAPMFRGIGS